MNPCQRIGLLTGLVAAGFSSVLLLPDAPPMRESRLARHLPAKFGEWEGRDVQISDKELEVLANDTGFERKSYQQRYNSTVPGVEVSIVFSGKDLNNSIHRPETCLKTQGWEFVRLRYLNLPGARGGKGLPVKEMLCKRVRRDENKQPVLLENGKPLEDWQLLYYTFIGYQTITPGHYSRTFADIRDRVVGGYDQTWAYATFSTLVTGKYREQGASLGYMTPMSIEETGVYLGDFIRTLTPSVLAPAPNHSNEIAGSR
jgi:hypothetical protein